MLRSIPPLPRIRRKTIRPGLTTGYNRRKDAGTVSQRVSDCEESELTDNIREVAYSPRGRRGYAFPDLFRLKFFFPLRKGKARQVLSRAKRHLAIRQ